MDQNLIMNGNNTEITASGRAYDASHQSTRPIFSGEVCYRKDNDRIVAKRMWGGIAGETVANETLVWSKRDGLLHASMSQPYLREEGALEREGNKVQFTLRSHKTQYNRKTSSMLMDNKSLVTLLSMPLEIVRNWKQLAAGEQFDRSYAVLKVQNHTGVRFRMNENGHQSIVNVTPLNPVWRYIFGPLQFVFEKGRPLLQQIFGLIEPRDHKTNGKYKEYVGTFKLDTPLDFGRIIVPGAAGAEVN